MRYIFTHIFSSWISFLFRLLRSVADCLNLCACMHAYIYIYCIQIIGQAAFTMMVLSTIVMTGIAAPLISILYDPARPYMVTNRRTIQHLPPGKELRTLLCIHDEESVSGFINLLESSNPTVTTPFSIFSLHLIELLARAVPVFIDHELQEVPSQYSAYDTIHNALRLYQARQYC